MSVGKSWLKALNDQKLEVRTARDALQVKGWLDTGNYALNWAISGRLQRGYPLGHTAEIFGDPSTGKSFLVARALGMAQERGGVAMLDDTEGSYNLDWIHTLGVDPDHLGYRRSRTVKEHLDGTLAFIEAYRSLSKQGVLKAGAPGILACDSLALLSTSHEREVKLDKRDMSKAAELKAFFRIVGGDFADLPIVHISTNHTIANIGDMFNQRTTSGGGGPKFQASVRIDLRAVSKIKVDGDYVGVICRAVIDKNRIVAPWKEVRLAVPFYRPVSRVSGLIPLLLDLGVLTLNGQFLSYGEQKLGIRAFKSKEKFLEQDEAGEELLDQVPELLDAVDDLLEKRAAMTWEELEGVGEEHAEKNSEEAENGS